MEHEVDGEILEFIPPLALVRVRVGAVITRACTAAALVLNSMMSTSRHGMERQRCLQRVDSTHVCTACRALREDMMMWRRQSGRALSRSGPPPSLARVRFLVPSAISMEYMSCKLRVLLCTTYL
jgi:hypothetical protein